MYKQALADMYKMHVKMTNLNKEYTITPSSVHCEVKLNFDGGVNVYTTMLLTPLNWSTFATQSRDSCICCALYEVPENRNSVLTKFKDIFQHIQYWIKNGFTLNNIHFEVRVSLVNDLKAYL